MTNVLSIAVEGASPLGSFYNLLGWGIARLLLAVIDRAMGSNVLWQVP